MRILTPEQIRQAENAANARGLSFETMMENAGRGCAEYIIKRFSPCKVLVLCGRGKNGGDGFVIARHLHFAGFSVHICNVFDGKSDALSETMRSRLPDGVMQTRTFAADSAQIIVDAVFGIGFHGQMPADIREIIEKANQAAAARIAVDIPSGLNMDFTENDTYFHADTTLSMLCYKPVHAFKPFSQLCGKTRVIPIGFDIEDIDENARTTHLVMAEAVKSLLKKRPYNAHKGTNGHTLLFMGSQNMPGAAVLAANGALSSGAGLVTLAHPDKATFAIAPQLPECLLKPLVSDKYGSFSAENAAFLTEICNTYQSIAVGCGCTQNEGVETCLLALLEHYEGKLLIDADGINILARHIDVLNRTKAQVVLTPHPGEAARLTGRTIAEINADREATAAEFAQKHNCVFVLKGANTVVAAPNGKRFINSTGNPGMARGGSGDLLTGIMAALLAQGLQTTEAAIAAVYLHGLSGDIATEKYSEYSATVQRTTACVPDAFLRVLEKRI